MVTLGGLVEVEQPEEEWMGGRGASWNLKVGIVAAMQGEVEVEVEARDLGHNPVVCYQVAATGTGQLDPVLSQRRRNHCRGPLCLSLRLLLDREHSRRPTLTHHS